MMNDINLSVEAYSAKYASKDIADWLRRLGNGSLDGSVECFMCGREVGVCSPLQEKFKVHLGWMVDFTKWEHYSGAQGYPITHPDFSDGEEGYETPRDLGGDDSYGDMRRLFCLWFNTIRCKAFSIGRF